MGKSTDSYKVRPFRIFFSILLFTSSFGKVDSREFVYAFREPGKSEKEKMILVGETVLYDKVKPIEEEGKNKYLDIGVDTRADLVTIKINFDPGLRVGQTLYLIEKDFDHKNYKTETSLHKSRSNPSFKHLLSVKERGESEISDS
ncbi:hypothetical protein LEP1GSC137_3694 [Leptospira borgpetersenii str. Noumea 25]|nr:hypothetical protein LEP1GSC137_3694 [Leptospira borgpetersenii str. Noumea 25]